MNIIHVMLMKEIMEVIRDRRVLSNILIMIVGLPLLYSLIIGGGLQKLKSDQDKSVNIHLIKDHYFQDFINQAKINGHQVTMANSVDFSKIKSSEAQVFVTFDKNFLENMRAGIPGDVYLYYDPKNDDSELAYHKASQVLDDLNQNILNNRIIANGMASKFLRPINQQARKLKESDRSLKAFHLITGIIFMIGIFLTIPIVGPDTITGERERKFLEPMLQLPINRDYLLIGRSIFLMLIGFCCTVVGVTVFIFISTLPLYQEYFGVALTVDLPYVLKGMALYLPLIFLVSWLTILLCSYAKSIKEAQLYSTGVGLVFMMFSSMIELIPNHIADKLLHVPGFGQAVVMDRFREEVNIGSMDILILTLSTLALGLVLFFATSYYYKQESIIVSKR